MLVHLRDIRTVSLTGEDAGSFKLEFHFNTNPFFTNTVSCCCRAIRLCWGVSPGHKGTHCNRVCKCMPLQCSQVGVLASARSSLPLVPSHVTVKPARPALLLNPPPSQVLEKTFYMENPDEVVPDKFVGCTIDWAAGKDTTGEPGSCTRTHRARQQQGRQALCFSVGEGGTV